MPPERLNARNPQEWLRHARSDLGLAKMGGGAPEVLIGDLCFHAQQAAEKAIKAVLVARSAGFPKTHVIVELLTLVVDSGIDVPADVRKGAELTLYAAQARYPGMGEAITQAEYVEAIAIAERVLRWAEGVIGSSDRGSGAP